MKRYSLCSNSFAPPSQRVKERIKNALDSSWADLDSVHPDANASLIEANLAMQKLRNLLSLQPSDLIIPTSSGAEAISHFLHGLYCDVVRLQGKNHLLSSLQEIAPILFGFEKLQTLGCSYDLLQPTNEGVLSLEELKEVLTSSSAQGTKPILFSISWADPLYGSVQPVEEIGTLCKNAGILFHLDITATLGKLTLDWDAIQPDIITCSGAPLGLPALGFLILREGIELTPFIEGGGQGQQLRGGEWNWPYILGAIEALQESLENQFWLCSEISRLRDKFERLLINALGDQILFPTRQAYRLPNQTLFSICSVPNELLAFYLHRQGFTVNLGGGQQQQLTQLMLHCGQTPDIAEGGICLSFDKDTTDELVEQLVHAILSSVEKISLVSGVTLSTLRN